ncbi:primase-helicase family protein [Mesorhizobium sp. IMUNJ 23232]|uniref:primase-helicase family protein n=1 Tax=Mesorhizobium sp. IMUNJ 23232 TaxID=3376064 RepID=UPI0037AA4243
MLASKGGLAALGVAPPITALWNGDAVELGKFFPDDSGKRPFDNSAAEQALSHAAAFFTGCNPARMERLMSRAPLCQRDKWQKRGDYRARTIAAAIADPNRKYLDSKWRREQRLAADIVIGDDLPTPPLPTFMTLDDMRRDLVHVGFGSQIVHRPSKTIRSKEDAASEYAASVTELDTGKLDKDGNPVMKRHQTLELWRRDASRTSVDVLTWQPERPEISHALEMTGAGQRAYNLWIPPRLLAAPPNWQDWAKPFIDHVAYLVPIESERTRFLQWLAHILQRPGELPHTCYLMIATRTGIGRGTFASILTEVLRGYVAANADVGMLLDKSFNGRLAGKLLATVDEIREGGSQRWQQQENFKSAVVEEVRHINPKFGRQHVERNCCRWLLFSNHLDALPFDNDDRRVIVIENPTVPAQDAWFEYLHGIIDNPTLSAVCSITLRRWTYRRSSRAIVRP